jgi:uncharacterized protein YyaL (SSP411 family)
MGTLITTGSLQLKNACSESYAFVTGSLWVEGHQWYSGSNYEAYFEEGIVYPFTCSNSTEVSWVIWACDQFSITGSLYNLETGGTNYHHS